MNEKLKARNVITPGYFELQEEFEEFGRKSKEFVGLLRFSDVEETRQRVKVFKRELVDLCQRFEQWFWKAVAHHERIAQQDSKAAKPELQTHD